MTEPQRDDLIQRLDRLERGLRQYRQAYLVNAVVSVLVLVLVIEDRGEASSIMTMTKLHTFVPLALLGGMGLFGFLFLLGLLLAAWGVYDDWRTGQPRTPLSAVGPTGISLQDLMLDWSFACIVMGAIYLVLDGSARTIIGLIALVYCLAFPMGIFNHP